MEEACLAPRPKWAEELIVVDHQLTTVHTSSTEYSQLAKIKLHRKRMEACLAP
jgi:hypothetical protein